MGVGCRAQGGGAAVAGGNGGTGNGSDAMPRGGGIVEILRVEHGDDGNGAGAIEAGPLTLHEGMLHGLPVIVVAGGVCFDGGIEGRYGDGIVVDETEEITELLKVDAHLIDELAERHLLRTGELVEVAAIGAGVFDGLDGGYAEEGTGLGFGDLRIERPDSSAVAPGCFPGRELVVELLQHLLQLGRVETGG